MQGWGLPQPESPARPCCSSSRALSPWQCQGWQALGALGKQAGIAECKMEKSTLEMDVEGRAVLPWCILWNTFVAALWPSPCWSHWKHEKQHPQDPHITYYTVSCLVWGSSSSTFGFTH